MKKKKNQLTQSRETRMFFSAFRPTVIASRRYAPVVYSSKQFAIVVCHCFVNGTVLIHFLKSTDHSGFPNTAKS